MPGTHGLKTTLNARPCTRQHLQRRRPGTALTPAALPLRTCSVQGRGPSPERALWAPATESQHQLCSSKRGRDPATRGGHLRPHRRGRCQELKNTRYPKGQGPLPAEGRPEAWPPPSAGPHSQWGHCKLGTPGQPRGAGDYSDSGTAPTCCFLRRYCPGLSDRVWAPHPE